MKWLKRIVVVVVVLAALVAAVPFFVTLNDYVPELEKELSAKLDEPVSIDSLHASLFPVPHARVDGIAIGTAQEIKVAKVTLTPRLATLFGSQKVIRSVEFDDVTLTQKVLGALVALAQRDSSSGTIRIESVRLRNAVLKLEHSSFGPFDADVEAGANGAQGHVTLTTRDDALQARITPQGERYALDVMAKGWTPPLGPKVRFDTLTIKGTATASGAELKDIDAGLYGGTAKGNVTIGWDKAIELKGAFEVRQVELKEAAALVSPKTRVSGRLDAKPKFTAQAAKASQLDEALRLETPFTVHNGVLHGFDLAAAAATLGKQTSGGQTRFDELAGHLVTERDTYRFTQLRIASGALGARGHVTIAPSKALSGQLNTSVKGAGAAVGIPLTVAGTLDSPSLYPNAGALVGAAAGTVVLPGVGTAAGAKLGEIAEGLFGKKR